MLVKSICFELFFHFALKFRFLSNKAEIVLSGCAQHIVEDKQLIKFAHAILKGHQSYSLWRVPERMHLTSAHTS